MNKYIDKFKKKNKLKCFKTSSKEKILICDRGRPGQIFFSCLFAYNINVSKGYNPLVLSDKKVDKEYNKNLYKSFNIDNFKYINLRKINYIFFQSIIKTINSILLLLFIKFDKFVETFTINKIYCGDLIWDTFIRHDHSFLNPKVNIKFIKILFITIYKIYYLEKIFNKEKIKIVLTSANNYSTLSAIALRMGLLYRVKTYFQKFHKVVKIKKFKDIRKSPFTLLKNSINKKYKSVPNYTFEKYFINRMNAKYLPSRVKKSSIDVISAFRNKIENKNIFFKKIDKCESDFKQICVFAPHAFSDCNHAFGKLIYRDYYQNFIETINVIKDDKKNLWIIKPHPSSYFFNEEGIVENIVKKFTSNNLVLCPNDISTKLILKISDKIVTSRGTIGLEAACFGKKAILTGSSPYSHLGISINPKSQQSYVRILKSQKKNKKLSSQKKLLAKKYLFWFGRDRMYDKLNFVENKWNEKDSFLKNLIKLQKSSTYDSKVFFYMNYLNKLD